MFNARTTIDRLFEADDGFNIGPLYQGGAEKYTSFQSRITGTLGYFVDSREHAEVYGDVVTTVYLKMRNPLDASEEWGYTEPALTLAQWKRWLAERGVTGVKFDSALPWLAKREKNEVGRMGKFDFWELVDPREDAQLDSNLIDRIKAAGYDGIIQAEGATAFNPDKVYLPFEASQIKVVEDEEGEAAP